MSRKSNYYRDNHVNRRGYDSKPKNKKDSNDMESNSKPKYRSGQVDYINTVIGNQNDPSWYNKLRALFQDSSLISFFNQLGAKFRTSSANARTPGTITIGGIMALDYISGPGLTLKTTDPASLAAIAMWEDIRSKLNKLNPGYSAADEAILQYCINDVYATYMQMWRAFMIINTWDANNLYMPKSLLCAALNIEEGYEDEFISDFIQNLANYRMDYNTVATEANTFLFVPADFDLFKRSAWLAGNVFRDHKTRKSQLYVYRKKNWYEWSDTDGVGSTAVCHFHRDGYRTFAEYIDQFRTQVEALRNSDSVRIMIADMRQAFADHNRFGMMYVSENDVLNIVESDEVLSQIENTEICPLETFNSTIYTTPGIWDIHQDVMTEAVVYNPTFQASLSGFNQLVLNALGNKYNIINLHWDNPSADDSMVATRNKWQFGYDDGYNIHFDALPTELVVGSHVWVEPDQLSGHDLVPIFTLEDSLVDVLETFIHTQSFSFHPPIMFIEGDAGVPDNFRIWPLCEWDNFTSIDRAQLQRMNTAAMMSLWAVDSFGVTG